MALELKLNNQTNLLKITIHINFVLVGIFGVYLLPHADIYYYYQGIFYVCACGLCSL